MLLKKLNINLVAYKQENPNHAYNRKILNTLLNPGPI